MADKTVWLITLGEVDVIAQSVAQGLRAYGLTVEGQRWPVDQPQIWMPSAQEAFQAHASLIVLVADPVLYANPGVRRSLALFRIALETYLNRRVDGFVLPSDDSAVTEALTGPGTLYLADWIIPTTPTWIAKAVARVHSPSRNPLPVRIGLYAHERLGVWLEVSKEPAAECEGFLVGVSGNDAKIDFHAVGPSGKLPDRSVNEYELQGLTFDVGGLSFVAWGVQNRFGERDSYFVRLDGEPDYLAIGHLPGGELSEVDLVRLA